MKNIQNLLQNAKIPYDCIEKIISYISTYTRLKLYIKKNTIFNKLQLKSSLDALFHNRLNHRTTSLTLEYQIMSCIIDQGLRREIQKNPIGLRPTYKIKKHVFIGGCNIYLWKDEKSNECLVFTPFSESGNCFNFTEEEFDSFQKLIIDLREDIKIHDLEQEKKRIEDKKVFDDDFDLEEPIF